MRDEGEKYPNCKKLNGDFCAECYDRFYLKDGACVEVNQLCKGYNKQNGYCTDCFEGYLLRSDGSCQAYTQE